MKLIIVCLVALLHSVYGGNTICGHLNAYQSTSGNWDNTNAYASLAIDGNDNTDWYKGKSCTHTAPNDPDPSLTIDLGCEKNIKSVEIANRADCCSARLNDFEVVLSSDAYSQKARGTVCNHYAGKLPGGWHKLSCVGSGRFVTIRYKTPSSQPTSQRYIHICEIKVNTA